MGLSAKRFPWNWLVCCRRCRPDNPPTRRIFGSVAVLTGAKAGDIASAIREAVASRDRLAANAESLKKDYPGSWELQASDVWSAIEADTGSGERPVT